MRVKTKKSEVERCIAFLENRSFRAEHKDSKLYVEWCTCSSVGGELVWEMRRYVIEPNTVAVYSWYYDCTDWDVFQSTPSRGGRLYATQNVILRASHELVLRI